MSQSMGAPDIEQETPNALDRAELEALRGALRSRHGDDVVQDVDARTGPHAAIVFVLARAGDRGDVELFAFVRVSSGNGSSDANAKAETGSRALSTAIDFIDGVLPEVKRGRSVPLDWESRAFAGATVLVRGERRDYAAERAAAKLLGEDARPAGIDGLAHRFD